MGRKMEVFIMQNVKYTYRWTANEDYNVPDNNYEAESDYIIIEPPYDFRE